MSNSKTMVVNMLMGGAATCMIFAVLVLLQGNDQSKVNAASICAGGSLSLTLAAMYRAAEKE